jgi:hypothetical protein
MSFLSLCIFSFKIHAQTDSNSKTSTDKKTMPAALKKLNAKSRKIKDGNGTEGLQVMLSFPYKEISFFIFQKEGKKLLKLESQIYELKSWTETGRIIEQVLLNSRPYQKMLNPFENAPNELPKIDFTKQSNEYRLKYQNTLIELLRSTEVLNQKLEAAVYKKKPNAHFNISLIVTAFADDSIVIKLPEKCVVAGHVVDRVEGQACGFTAKKNEGVSGFLWIKDFGIDPKIAGNCTNNKVQCNPLIFGENTTCVESPSISETQPDSTGQCLKLINKGGSINDRQGIFREAFAGGQSSKPLEEADLEKKQKENNDRVSTVNWIGNSEFRLTAYQAADQALRFGHCERFFKPGTGEMSNQTRDLSLRNIARECQSLRSALNKWGSAMCESDIVAQELFKKVSSLTPGQKMPIFKRGTGRPFPSGEGGFTARNGIREWVTADAFMPKAFGDRIIPARYPFSDVPFCQANYVRILIRDQELAKIAIENWTPEETDPNSKKPNVFDTIGAYVEQQWTTLQSSLQAIENPEEASDTTSDSAQPPTLTDVPLPRPKPPVPALRQRAPPLTKGTDLDAAYQGPPICNQGYRVVYRGSVPSCERINTGGTN